MRSGSLSLRTLWAEAVRIVVTFWAFLHHAIWRFVSAGCLTAAGALSYTTVVSLVPITAIALAVLSAFPIFASMRDRLLSDIFSNFVPEVGSEVEYWFRYFASTSVQTTTIGVLALLITVIVLLATIEDQLHIIWRVRSYRPWLQRILAYWAIMTLGPVLLGVSFSLPSYLDLMAQKTGLHAGAIFSGEEYHSLLHFLPFILETLAFTLLYALIPNCAVRWREAVVGALVTAALLELLKAAFGVYVAHFSSYRAVYGALAAIPIFLLWMYVAWSVVLFGAVVAAELPRWRYDEKGVAAAERLGLSLALLAELAEQARRGGTLSTAALAAELGVSATDVDDDLGLLAQSRFVAETIEGGWVLSRALDGATLLDLYRALKLPLAIRLYETGPYPWQARVGAALQRVASAEAQALNLPLGDLLGLGGRPGLAQRR